MKLSEVGLIGNGNHSKRIQKILKDKKIKYFIYKPKRPKYFDKLDFQKLLSCKIIFILSPNNTHLTYIKKLNDNNRYIFCEKPPVGRLKDLKQLIKIGHEKIYYNFNFRYSKISKILSNAKKYKLGQLLYGSIISGHGLAHKKEAIKNWRFDKKKSPLGILEIVGIHWIDLINYHYGISKINKKLKNIKKLNTSIDNCYINIKTKKYKEIDIFCSYTSPLINEKTFIFENGYVLEKNDFFEVRGPALNLDKNNFIKKPSLIKKSKSNNNREYEKTLYESVSHFIKTAKNKKNFQVSGVYKSLDSNKFLFK